MILVDESQDLQSVSQDGNTWQTAYYSLDDALDEAEIAASSTTPPDRIFLLVGHGTYRPEHLGGIGGSFVIGFGTHVEVIGGYLGLGYEQLNPGVNIAGTDPDNPDGSGRWTVLDGAAHISNGTSVSASNHVLVVNDSSSSAPADQDSFRRIANMTIRNGVASVGSSEGGGAYVSVDGELVFDRCSFEDHYAELRGGAMNINTGPSASGRLRRCYFEGNSAEMGGAIFLGSSSTVSIGSCIFRGNGKSNGWDSFTLSGGAIYVSPQSALLCNNTLFDHNEALGLGGAILWEPRSGNNTFTVPGDYMTLSHCTFTENSVAKSTDPSLLFGPVSERGAAIHVTTGGQQHFPKVLTINNSILYLNMNGPDLVAVGGPPTTISGVTVNVNYTDIGTWNGPGLMSPGSINLTNCIHEDPKFVNPSLYNYHLATGTSASPCIDAGGDTFVGPDYVDIDHDDDFSEELPVDLGSNAREFPAGVPDMGVYEIQ